MSTSSQEQQLRSAPSLERRQGARLVVLFEPKMAGPLAAMWLSHAVLPGSGGRPGRLSDASSGRQQQPRQQQGGVRFTLTRTGASAGGRVWRSGSGSGSP
jgi:hypothetical protein